MIVTAQPEASEAGARVLMRGGNAVDAAMAAALVQGVVDPQMCGIAGFGSCQIYLPGKGIHTCIDFHGKTPLGATPEMWADRIEGEARDGFGFVLRGNVNDLGYQSITTPGSLLAYFEAVRDRRPSPCPFLVDSRRRYGPGRRRRAAGLLGHWSGDLSPPRRNREEDRRAGR
jgi:gamma-glutamyltranspeptidase/glutathione hydrolase